MSLPSDPCPHRPPCPGCPRWGQAGPPAAALAALAELCAEAGAPPPRVESGPALGWRHRARLMVRGRAASPKVGLFQQASHRIVDVPRCGVHHPRVNEVAAAVRRVVRETGVAPYADRPHAGLLRAVQVVVERASGRAQVVIVTRSERPEPAAVLFDPLRRALGGVLHSLWWNGNPARTNAILGPHWEHVDGPDMVCESMAGARVFFPPGAFGQANLPLAERLVRRAVAWIADGARVAEFYAGTGALGLALLPRSERVVLNEREPAALDGLQRGIEALPAALRARVRVEPGAAGACAALAADADAVVVDPPRKGLDTGLLEALCTRPPARLVYASCGLVAFLREARTLAAAGLRPTELVAFDLFPFTSHVETLARFDRDRA